MDDQNHRPGNSSDDEISRRLFLTALGFTALGHVVFAPVARAGWIGGVVDPGGKCGGNSDICDAAHGGDICTTGHHSEDICSATDTDVCVTGQMGEDYCEPEWAPQDPDVTQRQCPGDAPGAPDLCNPPGNADYCSPELTPPESDECQAPGSPPEDVCAGSAPGEDVCQGTGSNSHDVCMETAANPDFCTQENPGSDYDYCTESTSDSDACAENGKDGDVCYYSSGPPVVDDDTCPPDAADESADICAEH